MNIYILFIVGKGAYAMTYEYRSEDSLKESVLSFDRGPRNLTQVKNYLSCMQETFHAMFDKTPYLGGGELAQW